VSGDAPAAAPVTVQIGVVRFLIPSLDALPERVYLCGRVVVVAPQPEQARVER
jgi:hypothetical protein